MEKEKERTRYFVFPYGEGVIGMSLSDKEIMMINRLLEQDPKKYEGTEGLFKALEEIDKK